MTGDIEMQDAPSIMTDDEEAIQHAECDRGHGEEVHGRNGLSVIAQEGEQCLAGTGSLGARRIQREIVRSEISKPSMRILP
jgi:hypothetical protein